MSEHPRYKIECAGAGEHPASLLLRWRELVAASESPEVLYQTPEFFDHVASIAGAGDRPALIVVRRSADDRILGLVPVRLRHLSFDFQLGRRQLGALPVHSVDVLGSVPMLPQEPELMAAVLRFLFARYRQCQAISLPSLPADGAMWAGLQEPPVSRAYIPYLLHDWRDCHRIPLPADFASYLQQFSSKRRYNLSRQLRQLREHGGGQLVLHCIERPEQVAALCAALDKLAPPQIRPRLLSEGTLAAFARRGLLLCYVMECGGETCALMLGARSAKVFHLYNIFHSPELARLSVGTSILHMAIEDLCDARHLRAIDFGYGDPAHSYQSSNVTQRRGHLLLLRRSLRNALAVRLHRGFCAVAGWAKRRLRPGPKS